MASALASVIHTVTPSSGSSSARASPIAPEPVPRSATVSGRGSARRQLEGHAGDDLGLRPRDQHPPVDREVEAPKAPVSEHVGQRLTRPVAGDHLVEVGDHARRRLLVEHALEPAGLPGRAARLLAQPAGDRVADVLARVWRYRLAPLTHRRASWRDRSSAARAATTSSRSPASTSARR